MAGSERFVVSGLRYAQRNDPSQEYIPATGRNKNKKFFSSPTHMHAAIHPGTIKANWGPADVWTIPEKDISELPGAYNRQLCEQAAAIKMTSAPWKLCTVPFPQGKSQAYFQLYFTPDNSI